MEVHCYVCHIKTQKWTQNLVNIKSKHSHTPVATFLAKLLDDYPTDRDLYHQANYICNECLSKIYAYDWTCIKAKEQETELRNLLLKTESVIKNLQFAVGSNERPGPINPLNGVVHIIDDEDYNHDEQTDNKANVMADMEMYSTSSKSTPSVAAKPNIQMTSNVHIKAEATAMCDIKPRIGKQLTTTLPQTQQQQEPAKTVTSKIEPIKKGKPIIVRVVKRVPFLKSNPSLATSQPSSATSTPSVGPSNVNETMAMEETPKTVVKTSPVKKSPASGKQAPICKFCDGRFPNAKILQV